MVDPSIESHIAIFLELGKDIVKLHGGGDPSSTLNGSGDSVPGAKRSPMQPTECTQSLYLDGGGNSYSHLTRMVEGQCL